MRVEYVHHKKDDFLAPPMKIIGTLSCDISVKVIDVWSFFLELSFASCRSICIYLVCTMKKSYVFQ